MSGYGSFAKFYSLLQRDVPYGDIAALIDSFVKRYSSENEVIVDLACGTGELTKALSLLGYDVYGVDISQEMLELAQLNNSGEGITYLRQDMSELELWGAADVVVCMLDSLNHLESCEKLERTIERVSMFTCEGGLFIFDINTEYKHRTVLADNCFVFDMEEDGLFCTWQNRCNDDGGVDIGLDFFEKTDGGRYLRTSEYFREMLIDEQLLEGYLAKHGFEVIGKYDDLSEREVTDTSQRLLYVCKRLADRFRGEDR